ncbi:MAG: hypothetical protein IPL61_39010 [Myxococcales bacterium]|nr:hypothetical protein [Myxococcales bacterium]
MFGDRDPALGHWASMGVRRRGDVAQHRSHPHLRLAIDDLIPLPWTTALRMDAEAATPGS